MAEVKIPGNIEFHLEALRSMIIEATYDKQRDDDFVEAIIRRALEKIRDAVITPAQRHSAVSAADQADFISEVTQAIRESFFKNDPKAGLPIECGKASGRQPTQKPPKRWFFYKLTLNRKKDKL